MKSYKGVWRGAVAVAFLAVLSCVALGQNGGSQVQEQNKQAVRKSFDAWGAGTGSPYDLLLPDSIWTITGNALASKEYPSKEAFLAEVIRPFNARMKGYLRPTIRNLYADGDTVIVFFDADGVARDGMPYHNTYTWYLQFRDGKIVRGIAMFDSIAFNDLWTRVKP